jgi:hypothetical protein
MKHVQAHKAWIPQCLDSMGLDLGVLAHYAQIPQRSAVRNSGVAVV